MLPSLMRMGMGRRRRYRRHRKRGGRKMLIQGSGMRKHRIRRMRGRGLFDTLKSIGSKAYNLARSVPIISTGLSLAGKEDLARGAKSLGFGKLRRRRHRTRYGGRMSVYGGRLRKYRKRKHKRGGRRHRKHRKMRGGFLGPLASALLGFGIRKKYRKRKYGGKRRATKRRFSLFGGKRRKRTYPTGLLIRRR